MENIRKAKKAVYRKKENPEMSFLVVVGFILLMIFYLAVTSYGQTDQVLNIAEIAQTNVEACDEGGREQTAVQPVFTGYRGINLGMTADEVRRALSEKPKYEDKDEFYYAFSDKESAQFVLDENKRVKMISVIYRSGSSTAPTYQDVFGREIPLETDAGGRINKLVNYPQAGFWIAYYQAAGENPRTTLTVQKIINVEN
jgi:hypothetical protein